MLEALGDAYGGGLSSSAGASAGYRGQIGLRSSWAHAVAHNIEFQAGDVLVTETSAPIWGYNAELERAMIIGPPTDEMRRLFDHTVAAQQVAFDAIRPGATCADVDGAVMRYFEENDLLRYWRQHTGHGDRPAQPRGAVPRRRRPHAARARAWSSRSSRVSTTPTIGGFRHSDTVVVTEDGIDDPDRLPERHREPDAPGLTSVPPHSSGSTSSSVSENVHWWPAGSSAVYWRSPYSKSVGSIRMRRRAPGRARSGRARRPRAPSPSA